MYGSRYYRPEREGKWRDHWNSVGRRLLKCLDSSLAAEGPKKVLDAQSQKYPGPRWSDYAPPSPTSEERRRTVCNTGWQLKGVVPAGQVVPLIQHFWLYGRKIPPGRGDRDSHRGGYSATGATTNFRPLRHSLRSAGSVGSRGNSAQKEHDRLARIAIFKFDFHRSASHLRATDCRVKVHSGKKASGGASASRGTHPLMAGKGALGYQFSKPLARWPPSLGPVGAPQLSSRSSLLISRAGGFHAPNPKAETRGDGRESRDKIS